MANIIKIKRKPIANGAGVPNNLEAGELAFSEADAKLYYGQTQGTGIAPIEIAGSGYVLAQISSNAPTKTGDGATGTWNISITGNAGTVTNGVYTTRNITAGSGLAGGGTLASDVSINIGQGDGISVSADNIAVDSTVVRTTGSQTISATHTFSGATVFGSNATVSGNLVMSNQTASTIASFDASKNVSSLSTTTYPSLTEISYVKGVTSSIQTQLGNKANTSTTISAGSGLAGGGDLSANRTIDIGQGDGISVSADSIAVDSTVVRTTGTQTINGLKTFGNNTVFGSGVVASGTNSLQAAATASTATQIAVFTSSPASSAQNLVTRTPAEIKTDIGLGNVTNNAQVKKIASSTNGYVPTWDGTSGDLLATGYSVETTLSGSSSALPRADAVKTYVDNLLGANDAMIFKGTLGSGGTITSLPTTHSAGWTYRIITAGTYAGKVCEVGDLIIAVVDRSGSSNTNDDWTVAQNNLDGAVIGPASATDNALAVYDGATGKLIKNSTFVPTTVGGNIINLTNPSAIRFIRVNADNTVSALSDSDFRTAIGAGTSNASGTVTSVAGTGTVSGLTLTGTVTSSGSLTLGGTLSVSNTNFAAQTSGTFLAGPATGSAAVPTFRAIAATDIPTLNQNTTGTASNITASSNTSLTSLSNLATVGTITSGTWSASTIAVDKGGTGQTSYTNGQLLIGNTTGNTLTKATLTQGTGVVITNGAGSITVAHNDTSVLNGLQGGNGISSITVDDFGHVTAVGTATYLTSATVCSAIADCTIDGGTF